MSYRQIITREDLLDWTVCERHARYVRHFHWGEEWASTEIPPETIRILADHFANADDRPGLLFPHLKRLYTTTESDSVFNVIPSPPASLTSFKMKLPTVPCEDWDAV